LWNHDLKLIFYRNQHDVKYDSCTVGKYNR
jgi:hypothetical protein